MPRSIPAVIAAASLAWLAAPVPRPGDEPAAVVVPNDNRIPAGRLASGVLRLDLEVRMGRWYPEADGSASLTLPVLAEVGRAPQIPAPLIRVPTGTVVEISVRNDLPDSQVVVRGLHARPGTADTLIVAPGERRTVRFTAGPPGTYAYGAWTGPDGGTSLARGVPPPPESGRERDQMTGAFVIDSAGARVDDRIFVMNIWGDPVGDTGYTNAVAINGKAWPYAERVLLTVGDSARWRWVNGTGRNHPMHLHGFYFRIDSRGTFRSDTIYAAGARRLAVTENLMPGESMSITWSPAEPGNWLFHCHIAFHAIPDAARFDRSVHVDHDVDHMAGLVLGIHVAPPPGWRSAPRPDPRRVRFVVEELPARRDTSRTVGVGIADGAGEARAVSPGPVLVLTRGRPTDVTVVNRLSETTAIHWHGLELESWSDGVAGWSGMDPRVAPPVAPGDSFVARLTMPRAGTFIYHTHIHDVGQITAGLYGPIVVLPPGAALDPETDHLFTAGWDDERIVVNGDTTEAPLAWAGGRPHRLRFINIGPAQRLRFSVERDSGVYARWRPLAKDGADLPAFQAAETRSTEILDVGETLDAGVSLAPGVYAITARMPGGRTLYRRRVEVR
jgi:FtsP/CotA-like multicopper oxidase with cupredoxin domain